MGTSHIMISVKDLEKGQFPQKHVWPQNEARSILPNAYYDVVRRKLQRRPWLESLYQFMDPGTDGFAMPPSKRMEDFDIKVIHFTEPGKPDPAVKCSSEEEFKRAISEERAQMGTLVLVEGLSRAMIEVLGTTYNLEPEFFASFLEGTESYRQGRYESPLTRPPARSPYLLPDYIRKVPFYTVEYRRPYYIEGGQQAAFQLRATATNTSRGVACVHPDLPDVFASEKISVYKKMGSRFGIILTDKLLSDISSASYIPTPVSLLNDFDDALETDGFWRQVSARQEIISWVNRLAPEEVISLFHDQKQLSLQPVLKIVERHGVMFLLHTRYIMSRVLTHSCDAKFPNSIPFFLHVSRALHRYIHLQQRILRSTLAVASLRGGDDIAEQKEDLAFLERDLDKALSSLEQDVQFLVGEASVREGKIVGWVSKFAALFLPVSLLATILSISDPGYVRWSILGGLGVPFVLVSIYLMFMFPNYFSGLGS